MSSVLFLSLVGPPDGVSTARLVGGLAAGLADRGHTVRILTTAPHYNRDAAAEARQPIAWGALGLVGRSRFEGVEVIHVAMPRKGRVVTLRLMAWIWFHMVSTLVGLLVLPRHEVVIAPSPPLTIGISAWVLARLRRSSFVYNVQEVYPDIAVQLGALRSPVLIWALGRLERFVYARARVVTAISPGIADNLRGKGVPTSKLVEIPNFVDPLELAPTGAPNPFATAHGLEGQFVVTYAGNIGRPQRVDVLVEAAETLRTEDGLKFVIVGEGSAKAEIETMVGERRLANVLVLPYQPYETMPQVYGATRVSVVLQSSGTGTTAIPSKAIQIIGAGQPILAVTDADSDLAHLVRRWRSGLVVQPGHPETLAAAVREMRAGYGGWLERAVVARAMIFESFSKVAVVDAYHRLVGLLAQGAVRRPSGGI